MLPPELDEARVNMYCATVAGGKYARFVFETVRKGCEQMDIVADRLPDGQCSSDPSSLHMLMSLQPQGARKCYKSHANDLTINRMGQTNWQTSCSNSANKLQMCKQTISTFIVR